MESSELILLVIAGIIGLFILVRIAKTLFKVAFIALFALGGYYLWTSGSVDGWIEPTMESMFKNTTISELMDKHCSPSSKDGMKCQCIVTPVYNDLNMRFSKSELTQLEQNKKRMVEEMLTSMKTQKKEMESCLKSDESTVMKMFNMAKSLFNMVSS